MKKVIRLTESDLTRIVKRVISEQSVTATTNARPATTNARPATTNARPATGGGNKSTPKETISSVNSPMTVNLYNDADVNKMVFDSGSIKDTTSLNKTLTDNKGLHFVEFVIKTNLHGDKLLRWYYSFPESFMEWSPSSGVKTGKEYFNNKLRDFLTNLHYKNIKNPKAKFN